MENITSITGLANALGIPWVDLLIPCTFCGKFMDYHDLTKFESQMQLLWKGKCVYGCCNRCARLSSRREVQLFGQGTKALSEVLKQGIKLTDLVIRCVACLNKLTYVEKLSVLYGENQVTVVRGRYRGICKNCKPI
ncbi:E6 protein [Sus scrofa papillomavirus 2]|uniref:Protein E6 n=1 Tax=Sus scrofa papillomavirus 2 TaxID=2025338 RepID=A0A223FQT7_9PAPI|nr:E6 protein [Sus scrofa papillomavirus 2]AST11574.1 E6 protein [Sus scrofa papillomavirus 2]